MTDLESQLRARLLQTFLLEASEQLSLMTRTLDELELGGDPVQPLEVFYRAAQRLVPSVNQNVNRLCTGIEIQHMGDGMGVGIKPTRAD